MTLARKVVCIFSLMLVACGPAEVSRAELITYISDPANGLSLSREYRGLLITLQYLPNDLIIDKQLTSGSEAEVDSLHQELKDVVYFSISLSRNAREIESSYTRNPEKYSAVMAYLSEGILKDMYVIVNSRKVNASQLAYIPGYGLTKATTILVAFRADDFNEPQTMKFIWEDSFFGSGSSEIKIESGDLSTPRLIRPS